MALSSDLSTNSQRLYEALIYQQLDEIQGKLAELHLEGQAAQDAMQETHALQVAKREQLTKRSIRMSTRPKLSTADYFAAQRDSIAQVVSYNELEDVEVKLTNLAIDQQAIAIAMEEHHATQAALQFELETLQVAMEHSGQGPKKQENYREVFDNARGFDVDDDAVFCPHLNDETAT